MKIKLYITSGTYDSKYPQTTQPVYNGGADHSPAVCSGQKTYVSHTKR